MTAWGERIKEARERKGLSLSAFARMVGVSAPSASDWEKGHTKNIEGRHLVPAAEILGVSAEWIMSGKGSRPGASVSGSNSGRSIPIISRVAAGAFAEAVDSFAAGDGEGWIPVDLLAVPVGPHAFGLRVSGDSMREDYQEGDVIVVDPDVVPKPRAPVVARRDEDNEATFKLYHPRGNDANGNPIIELVPLNEYFPKLVISAEHPGRIIGPVVNHLRGVRQP